MSIGQVLERKERPAFVRFERVAVEDKAASLKAGHYVAKDIDFAFITPPYSKDVFKKKVDSWFESLQRDMQTGRIPQEWVDGYKRQYEAWRNGQEIPLNGTAIKGWGVISPAQQETLIRMHVLTVEDLAAVNDEGIKRIGMGAVELKHKAQAWLAQLNDKGPLTQEVAALKTENATLATSVESLTARVEALTQQLAAATKQPVLVAESQPEGITAADILESEEPEPPKRGPGRPRKA